MGLNLAGVSSLTAVLVLLMGMDHKSPGRLAGVDKLPGVLGGAGGGDPSGAGQPAACCMA